VNADPLHRWPNHVARDAGGFRITRQGLAFVWLARFLSKVFQTDPRFVTVDGLPESHKVTASGMKGGHR